MLWKCRKVPANSGVDAHLPELPPAAAAALVRRNGLELVERGDDGLAEEHGRGVRILVGAAGRLRHDRVDHTELEAVLRVEAERGGRLLRLADVPPEDR